MIYLEIKQDKELSPSIIYFLYTMHFRSENEQTTTFFFFFMTVSQESGCDLLTGQCFNSEKSTCCVLFICFTFYFNMTKQ